MEIEPIRAQWLEIEKKYADLNQGLNSVDRERLERRIARQKRWRQVGRLIPSAVLVVLLGMALIHIFVTDRGELSFQSAAFLFGVLGVLVMNWVGNEME